MTIKPKAVLLTTLVAFAAGGLGFLAGSRRTDLEERIASFTRTETLGRLADEERAVFALAYDSPDRALKEMDGYTWAVRNQPTPFVGVAPLPGRQGNSTIGSSQFRHADAIEIPKPGATVRIFVTGGSTAFGTGAPGDGETIPAYLQSIIDERLAPIAGKRYEVINAANPAWASTHERILIENRLSELEPDLVISLSGNNDVHFGWTGLDVLWFRTYAEQHFAHLVSKLYELAGYGSLGIQPVPRTDGHPVPPAEVLRRLEKNLFLATAVLERTGVHYVFALQPTLADTRKALSAREREHAASRRGRPEAKAYFAECYDLLRERLPGVELEGFHFIDLSTVFDGASADEEIFLDSYHFGDRGNRMLAEQLFSELLPLLERL